MPTIEHLFSQGVIHVRRPDWSPETWLELQTEGGRLSSVVILHRDGKRQEERLKLIGGGQTWVAASGDRVS